MTFNQAAFLHQLGITLRLHFRNRMALLYSYAFPTIFLVVFWVLYRHETEPLARHLGELLTVTALGGACFGLPTSLVAERERGVWRRFRLTPASRFGLLATTALARWILLVLAALLQVGLAMAVFGMPVPRHPIDLFVAFTLVAFAFIGLGLLIATVADNVPAVQALGQCIFLPMLVIGGVAVRIETLPVWAQHLSAYFPGRYAVAALQVATTGDGLPSAAFSVLALLLIGAAGCFAGVKLFRWDQQQRFMRLEGKGWAAGALAVWAVVGILAGVTGQVTIGVPHSAGSTQMLTILEPELAPDEQRAATADDSTSVAPAEAETPVDPGSAPDSLVVDTISADDAPPPVAEPDSILSPPVESEPPAAQEPREAEPLEGADTWRTIDPALMQEVNYAALPPDQGVIAPVASPLDAVFDETRERIQCIQPLLAEWPPGQESDAVQRVRNYLYIAATVDLYQIEQLERMLPLVIFDLLETTVPADDLTRILYWLALHPEDGEDDASGQLSEVCIDLPAPCNRVELRARTQYYALKLLGRIVGTLPRQ